MGENLLDSVWNIFTTIGAAGQQYDLNKNIDFMKRIDEKNAAEQARKLQLADLEDERKYNSPAEQSKRLNEAGINPFYTIGGADMSPSITSLDTDTYQPDYKKGSELFSIGETVDTFLRFAEMNRQQNLTDKQLELYDAQILNELDNSSKETKDEIDELRKSLLEKQNAQLDDEMKTDKDVLDKLGKSPWLKHGLTVWKLLWQMSKGKRR